MFIRLQESIKNFRAKCVHSAYLILACREPAARRLGVQSQPRQHCMIPLSKLKNSKNKVFFFFLRELFLKRKLVSVENSNVLCKTRTVKKFGGAQNVLFGNTKCSSPSKQVIRNFSQHRHMISYKQRCQEE